MKAIQLINFEKMNRAITHWLKESNILVKS